MKKVMLAVFVCLLSTAVFAKTNPAASDKAASSPKTKTASLVGCVEGSGGGYAVKSGKKDVAVTSSEDLAGHVGHKVKLIGTWMPGADKKAPKTFNATKVDMVSDSCHAKTSKSTKMAKKSDKKS